MAPPTREQTEISDPGYSPGIVIAPAPGRLVLAVPTAPRPRPHLLQTGSPPRRPCPVFSIRLRPATFIVGLSNDPHLEHKVQSARSTAALGPLGIRQPVGQPAERAGRQGRLMLCLLLRHAGASRRCCCRCCQAGITPGIPRGGGPGVFGTLLGGGCRVSLSCCGARHAMRVSGGLAKGQVVAWGGAAAEDL